MRRTTLTIMAAACALIASPALASHTITTNPDITTVGPISGTFGPGGGTVTGTLVSQDLAFFTFFSTAGDNLSIRTNPITGQFDTGLSLLFDASGPILQGDLISSLSLLAEDDDSGAGVLSLINFTTTQTGRYAIALGGFGGGSGNYSLSLNGNTGSVQNAVPEPATWAMMLLGFGLVGGAMRSRRRQKLTVSYT